MTNWTVTATDAARSPLNREYNAEMISRYWGRPTHDAEIDAYERDEQDHDVPVFLVVSRDGEEAGCLGMRFLGDGAGELTRMFVRSAFRGQGAASALLTAMETEAAERGITTLRLDTRGDLVEARSLYAKHGFVEIGRYNDAEYADHWFEKRLTSAHPVAMS
ncbi:Ribosomal protein S18 acetylase RimI [Lentzea albidocapillata subsp. violacea]|uniref:Ribosomal protein S18 acetylase RimI n=1 Tax=Lentzea albidocapillata subsp. violacea TaxID=128104 RepID=A0A1G9R9R0_9PSEU|nr:GNAT family N-acetyltransferase [Lentzea albidocapillata]SDM19135.1 Ribosomal protein S18 acetylase RimI [Lentzea albidocapillata subsp. violacea]